MAWHQIRSGLAQRKEGLPWQAFPLGACPYLQAGKLLLQTLEKLLG